MSHALFCKNCEESDLKILKKKIITLGLALTICAGSLTGCGSDTKIIFTSGLSGNQLFKIGSACCTMPEIMIYLTTFYNQYEKTYGEEMWQYDFGGISLEEHVKDIVISKMAQIKVMTLMAKEYHIELSEEEKAKVSQAADAYYEQLPETLKKKENITLEIAEKVFEEYTLANKVYASITEAADMEISDDEARTVTVQEISFHNWKLQSGEPVALEEGDLLKVRKEAENALERITQGEAFEIVAAECSEEKQLAKSYARGDAEEAYEKVIFALDEGEVSGLLERKDGFYIVKCISTMNYEATQANKLVLAEKRKKEAFSKAYEEIAANTHSQFRDRLWEALSLDEETHKADVGFFEIYEEYIKQ